MTTPPAALHPADRSFLAALEDALGEAPDVTLARPIDGEPRVRLDGGRIVALSLRDLGATVARLPFGLLDALEALDVTGLGLDTLDLVGLHRLTTLRCADNQLTHLEPGDAPALRTLEAGGNRLMLLDLRRNGALHTLDVTGNQLTGFLFPDDNGLVVLRCARNELIVLDLGDVPALTELVCFRNPLVELRIASAPRLRTLDVARAELKALPLSACPALEALDASRNRLAQLDLAGVPRLRRLDVDGNYVEALDLRPLERIADVSCQRNQLRELILGAHADLDTLRCGENRLASLDLVGCTALVELACAGNALTRLALTDHPALCAVDAADNPLADVTIAAPGLASLRLVGAALRQIDVRGFPELSQLDVDDDVEILATDPQRRLLRPSSDGDPADLDPWALHAFARSVRGPDAEERLLDVIRSPRCDLGTALLVYWTRRPHWFHRYAAAGGLERYERAGYELVDEIERRVADGFYARREIWFDPRRDKQTRSARGYDWTREARERAHELSRAIPEHMMAPSRPRP